MWARKGHGRIYCVSEADHSLRCCSTGILSDVKLAAIYDVALSLNVRIKNQIVPTIMSVRHLCHGIRAGSEVCV